MLMRYKDGQYYMKESTYYWTHLLSVLLVFLIGGEIGYMKAKRKLLS